MASLVLDRNGLRLAAEGRALALYDESGRRGTVPLGLLDRVVLQGGGIGLETGVLLRLAEAGVATVLLSGRSARRVATLYGAGHNDVAARLGQAQAVADAEFCLDWSRALVAAKVSRQRKLLDAAQEERPDARKPVTDARTTLAAIAGRIPLAVDLAALRGHEGAAAAAYFGGLAAVFAPALGFNGRNRRPPRDPVNAALSLAYTLATADAARAAFAAGLDPLIGFYHRPAFGRESLACDLVEPLRPAVDRWVWRLFRERSLRLESFHTERGACLLGKAGRERFYAGYEKASVLWRRWLRQTCRRLTSNFRARCQGQIEACAPGAEDEEF